MRYTDKYGGVLVCHHSEQNITIATLNGKDRGRVYLGIEDAIALKKDLIYQIAQIKNGSKNG